MSNIHYLVPPIEPPVQDEIRAQIEATLCEVADYDLVHLLVVGVPRKGGDLLVAWSEGNDNLPMASLLLAGAQDRLNRMFANELREIAVAAERKGTSDNV